MKLAHKNVISRAHLSVKHIKPTIQQNTHRQKRKAYKCKKCSFELLSQIQKFGINSILNENDSLVGSPMDTMFGTECIRAGTGSPDWTDLEVFQYCQKMSLNVNIKFLYDPTHPNTAAARRYLPLPCLSVRTVLSGMKVSPLLRQAKSVFLYPTSSTDRLPTSSLFQIFTV